MPQAGKTCITFCIPNMVIGGVETVFETTIDALAKNPDIDIRIVTHARVREPLHKQWLKSHPEIPVYVCYPLQNWFQDLVQHCRFFPLRQIRKIAFSLYKKYRRVILRHRHIFDNTDVIIDYKNFEFFKELRHVKRPKIAWAHSAMSYFESIGAFSRLPIYDVIVGITDDFVTDFKHQFPQYANNIVRIYNPINIAAIRARAACADTPDDKYFCHVSRLVDGKDIKTLLRAFDAFAADADDTKLYIVGDGNRADDFKKYASELKSCDRIVFTGALSNPYGIMRGAIANILSSEFEGFGMVLVESLALDVPCISSKCKNGPREILMDGAAGFLFTVGDATELTTAMSTIANKHCDIDTLHKNMAASLVRFDPRMVAIDIADLAGRMMTAN